MINLPDTIKVGHRTFRIRRMNPAEASDRGTAGHMLPQSGEIVVGNHLDDVELANTLMHEIFHAIWLYFGCDDNMNEEQVVRRFAHGLSAVMVDNPSLLPTLQLMLKEDTWPSTSSPAFLHKNITR